MAEGWARHLKSNLIEPYSAGLRPGRVDPRAIKAMAEAGINISAQRSKAADELADNAFDFVITLCEDARGACPVFPAARAIVHRGFDDPPTLALFARTEEEAMGYYRKIRDEIRKFIESLPDTLEEGKKG